MRVPRIIGHRGAAKAAPENTLAGMREAKRQGASWVEFDAKLTSDNAIILLHELIGIGLRNGAIRAVVIHSSGPSSYAHHMFRYILDPEFDWSGEISLTPDPGDDIARPDRLVTELETATGIPKREDE